MANVILDEEHRICAISDGYDLGEGQVSFDFPDGFDYSQSRDYKIIDGELVRCESVESMRNRRIQALESLRETDYVALKLAESIASGASCDDLMVKYADILSMRVEWRREVDDLSDVLNE